MSAGWDRLSHGALRTLWMISSYRCRFMTSCFTSHFPSIQSFSLSSLSLLILPNVFIFSSTQLLASSNVTSHLLCPSTDHSRLVFRALQPVPPVSRETPAGRVDRIYGNSAAVLPTYSEVHPVSAQTNTHTHTHTHTHIHTDTETAQMLGLQIPQLPPPLKWHSDIYPCFLSGSVQFFVFTLLFFVSLLISSLWRGQWWGIFLLCFCRPFSVSV